MRMNKFIVFCSLLLAVAASDRFESKRINKIQTDVKPSKIISGQFTTKLDHFRPQNLETVNLTYFENAEFYQSGGPLYVYFKAIGDNSTDQIEDGLMVQLAKENHATLLTFNYRYFGENRLFDDLTWENYQFLTIEQIVSDAGTFIDYARSTHSFTQNTVVWGSRFGALIANYVRQKFPHLVNGAWSSSGSFDLYHLSFVYYDLLRSTLSTHETNNKCVDRVFNAFNQLNALVSTEIEENLQNTLNLCSPLDAHNLADFASLAEKWIDILGEYIDQYHIQGVISFCNDIESSTSDALSSFVRWINFVSNSDVTCFDHSYSAIVNRFSNTSIVEGADRRSWYYLQCTQAGFLKVADQFTWLPLRVSFDYQLTLCADILGQEYFSGNLIEAVKQATVEFGDIFQFTSEVIYTNGAIDPWLNNNYLGPLVPSSSSYFIQYASASSDLGAPVGWDTVPVAAIKKIIAEKVVSWSHKY